MIAAVAMAMSAVIQRVSLSAAGFFVNGRVVMRDEPQMPLSPTRDR